MKKLEVFFDYHCPYCLKGHEQLAKFVQDNPGPEIIWHPCEIYKLPGNYMGTKRTANCIQGFFFAADNGVDLWRFHDKVYSLIFKDNVNVEDIKILSESLGGLLDADALRQAVKNNNYVENVNRANRFAFQETGIHVVPTYRADGGFLMDRQEFFKMGPSDTAYGGKK